VWFALNSFTQVVFNPGEFSEREDVGDAVKVEMDKLVCTLATVNSGRGKISSRTHCHYRLRLSYAFLFLFFFIIFGVCLHLQAYAWFGIPKVGCL
jgi:hypothetical protein